MKLDRRDARATTFARRGRTAVEPAAGSPCVYPWCRNLTYFKVPGHLPAPFPGAGYPLALVTSPDHRLRRQRLRANRRPLQGPCPAFRQSGQTRQRGGTRRGLHHPEQPRHRHHHGLRTVLIYHRQVAQSASRIVPSGRTRPPPPCAPPSDRNDHRTDQGAAAYQHVPEQELGSMSC